MISIDEHPPPDPSSSDYQNQQQQQQQVSHEALATVSDIDLLKPKGATTLDDTNNPHPKFAIRDYVYGSRCKNIARHWPFSHKSLQLCLNHSVNNILPPFESLDSLRSNQSVIENHFPNEETVTKFNRKSQSVKSQCQLEEDLLAHTKSNSQPTVKKCKLVMKLNSGGDPGEDTVASCKVCPVCRTFSSSSNTTLNAHIDQCLSEESSMKSTANPKIKTVTHRIKPRKTRLMVDIYKTAPHCTVEELDRRNGTSWATNSSFPDQELELQAAEEKKEEPIIITPKIADHEGAVYIDTNGTKVRILSINKLDDDDNARKLQKGERGSKIFRGKKKILKLSPNSKKLSKKVTIGQKENVATLGSYKKDGGENHPMKLKGQANKQMDIVSITRPPWACSKRTAGVAKKRFPMLTKPKEAGNPLYDSSEDPSVVIRTKGCKFSSLEKNVLLSASLEQNNAGSKLNLKRKISAIKKPQDSWKQNPRMEKIVKNVSEVKKKRSNGNEDSSCGGVIHEITTESTARIEVPIFDCDEVGIDEGNNLMGLRKYSLDDELSKIVVGEAFEAGGGGGINVVMSEMEELEKELEPLILIPGPPGCFLPPSPGADDHHHIMQLVSEEEEDVQGNSSLTTTSRVHSNELVEQQSHHDLLMKTDHFVSESPLVSTVSSHSFARSCDKLSSSRLINSQQNKKSVNSSELGSSVDHAISFTEKTPTPCCCSRKEGGVPSSYDQEYSPLLELNRGPYNRTVNFMPHLFSLKSPPPEETVNKSPASVKLPDSRDGGSPTTTTPPPPVLRLMGKNLTVVRTTDDDDGLSIKPPACSRGPPAVGQNFQLNKNNDDDSSAFFLYGHHHHHHEVMFSCHNNQNGPMHDQRRFNNLIHPSNNYGRNMDSTNADICRHQ